MSSSTRFVCPITNKSARVALDDAPDGVFVVAGDEDDALALPLRWGRLTLEVVVPNPEIAAVLSEREREINGALRDLRQRAESEEASAEEREQLLGVLQDGTAEQDIRAVVEERHPLPEDDEITVRASFSAISDEAIRIATEALSKAGFTFSDSDNLLGGVIS